MSDYDQSDNSIPLGIKQPQNPLAQVGDFAKTAAAFQSIKNQQAALPGIQADSQMKQRAAAFQQFQADHHDLFIDKITDPNTGQVQNVVNPTKLAAAANAYGFTDEGTSVAAHVIANASAEATAKGVALDNNKKTIENTTLLNDSRLKIRSQAENFMLGYQNANPDASQDVLDAKYNDYITKTLKATSDAGGAPFSQDSLFGPPGTDGKYHYNRETAQGISQTALDPTVRENLYQFQQNITGPAGRDVNSDVTKSIQKLLIAANPKDAELIAKQSAAQLYGNPANRAFIDNNMNPASNRLQNYNDAMTAGNTITRYQNVSDSIHQFGSSLSPAEQQQYMTSPNAFLSSWLLKNTNNPNYIKAKGLLAELNDPTMGLTGGSDLRSFDGLIQSKIGVLQTQKDNLQSAARTPQISDLPTPKTAPSPNPNTPKPGYTSNGAKLTKDDIAMERQEAAKAIASGKNKDKVAQRFKSITGEDY
jgi:hypothetical protein